MSDLARVACPLCEQAARLGLDPCPRCSGRGTVVDLATVEPRAPGGDLPCRATGCTAPREEHIVTMSLDADRRRRPPVPHPVPPLRPLPRPAAVDPDPEPPEPTSLF